MMWTLVLINMMFNAQSQEIEPVIEAWYEFETMNECFIGREALRTELVGPSADHFPAGTQAVCIQKVN